MLHDSSFPLSKLIVLLVRQASSPIATRFKDYAKDHDFFRKKIILPTARLYNRGEVKVKMWILNLGAPVNIPVLSDAQALELGGKIFGEGVLFIIGALLVIAEFSRQANNEEKKQELIRQEWENVAVSLKDLTKSLQDQQTRIDNMFGELFSSKHDGEAVLKRGQ